MPNPSHKPFEEMLFLVITVYVYAGLPRCTEEKRLKFQDYSCNPSDAVLTGIQKA
jgi:hypothetical protein